MAQTQIAATQEGDRIELPVTAVDLTSNREQLGSIRNSEVRYFII
jgi:hypothetical protein